jgi:hypothetical protein
MKISTRKQYLYLALLFSITGCGPGTSDYSEKINGSELIYIDSNTLNKVIVKHNQQGQQKTLIGPTILSYQVEGDHLIGVRQVVNYFLCGETRSDVEVTDHLEFFEINLSSQLAQYNTLSFNNFSDFKKHLQEINIGVAKQFHPDLLSKKLITTSSLGNCRNPKMISD